MYPSHTARELGILLRISRELDVVGDVTAIVNNPSELLAWATTLANPAILAWRAGDSGGRYIEVSADHHGEPVRGRITAVLRCDEHLEFWWELTEGLDLAGGDRVPLTPTELARAWEAMPVTPPIAPPG